ncbi:putative inner membrane protein [Klebsiella pneumoniae]|uniref:Putative inner membrane protein n=1 Tax=Klebsiella pneumoniae TaxID=573 RepID=A0A2X3F4X9_KLEPN|nr:putative inner membrane protein [Klebsiella pneumoniae]
MTWQSFKQAWLIRFWSPVPAVIAAGILSTYYFGITGTFWAVTGEFTRWGGQLLQLLGVHSEQWGYYQLIHLEGSPLTRIDGRMIIGMFGGCLAAALWANNVKLRLPRSRIRIAQAVGGRHHRRVRRTAGDGLQPGGLLHRHSAVLPARLAVCHRHRHRLLVWRPLHAAAPFFASR